MADKGIAQTARDAYRAAREFQTKMGATPAGKVWDALREGMADAITDIRQKVVEEPWFGRAVTPQLVKEVDPVSAGGIHGKHEPAPAADPGGGIHGPAETGPKPDPAPIAPEKSPVYREQVERLLEPDNRPGMSFAEAVAERYGWGKEYWPAKKDIAEYSVEKDKETPAPDQGVER